MDFQGLGALFFNFAAELKILGLFIKNIPYLTLFLFNSVRMVGKTVRIAKIKGRFVKI
ncbi:MAG TPA: hypothetical protein VK998_09690 [Schnuerera sp.]|nr:hypothetical protein [Schnuerera sp.]